MGGVRAGQAAPFLAQVTALPKPGSRACTRISGRGRGDASYTQAQFERFRAVIARLAAAGIQAPIVRTRRTARARSISAHPTTCVRLGLIAYGVHRHARPLRPAVEPVMSLRSRVVQVRPARGDEHQLCARS